MAKEKGTMDWGSVFGKWLLKDIQCTKKYMVFPKLCNLSYIDRNGKIYFFKVSYKISSKKIKRAKNGEACSRLGKREILMVVVVVVMIRPIFNNHHDHGWYIFSICRDGSSTLKGLWLNIQYSIGGNLVVKLKMA